MLVITFNVESTMSTGIFCKTSKIDAPYMTMVTKIDPKVYPCNRRIRIQDDGGVLQSFIQGRRIGESARVLLLVIVFAPSVFLWVLRFSSL